MAHMSLTQADDDRYDQHLGTAAEAALANGNEQLAALLADCPITERTSTIFDWRLQLLNR